MNKGKKFYVVKTEMEKRAQQERTTFSMNLYITDKNQLRKEKECWDELHDRIVLADREYPSEVL